MRTKSLCHKGLGASGQPKNRVRKKINAACIATHNKRSTMANRVFLLFAGLASLGVILTGRGSVASDRPENVAAKVDQLLREEVPYANAAKTAPARIDDERFLRRVSLDIIGR